MEYKGLNIPKFSAYNHKMNYDYDDAEGRVYDVIEYSFSGGYYTPAKLTGHPDSWMPEEGEPPEVDYEVWVWNYEEGKEDDPNKPDYIIEIKDGKVVKGADAPKEVVDRVLELSDSIIEKNWDPTKTDEEDHY